MSEDMVERVAEAAWKVNQGRGLDAYPDLKLPDWGDPNEETLWEDWRNIARAAIQEVQSESDTHSAALRQTGEAGRMVERAAIVAWLRDGTRLPPTVSLGDAARAADAIESGQHVREGG